MPLPGIEDTGETSLKKDGRSDGKASCVRCVDEFYYYYYYFNSVFFIVVFEIFVKFCSFLRIIFLFFFSLNVPDDDFLSKPRYSKYINSIRLVYFLYTLHKYPLS